MISSIFGSAKNSARECLYGSGCLGAFHWLRNRRTLTTFMFHRVLDPQSAAFRLAEREFTMSVDGFSACLDFIQHHYNVVRLGDIGAAMAGDSKLPDRAALITFDDGWLDTLTQAYPELKKRGLPVVIFLATESLSSKFDRWWQDALVEIVQKPLKRAQLCREILHLNGPDCVNFPFDDRAVYGFLAQLSESDRMRILTQVNCSTSLSRQMLNFGDLAEFDPALVELGAHGHTHAPLTCVKDPVDELRQSRDLLVSKGIHPVSMSFPHGDYDAGLVKLTAKMGFTPVFTSDSQLTPTGHAIRGVSTLGRFHVPENQWTCRNGKISNAMLATYLFFRPVGRSRVHL